VVVKDTKAFNSILLLPCIILWDFSKKSKSDNILNIWKMTFQASDLKEKQFLDLLDDDNNINHALIGKYRLRFFPREEFRYPCRLYPIESRCHILHECRRFNGYWNLRKNFLGHFVMFLETNLSAFTFIDSFFLSVMSRPCN